MSPCVLCSEGIEAGTPAVSIAGGMFPREEPDMFMIDPAVLQESYAHLNCLVASLATQRKEPSG